MRQLVHDVVIRHLCSAYNEAAAHGDYARSWDEERESRTIKPTVIIGLGGAGCGIGARLKKTLQHYYRGMPQVLDMVQFVMLDTEGHSEHRDTEVRSAFSRGGEYVFLGGFNPALWLAEHLERDVDLQRWWPRNVALDGLQITDGCKRLRPLGRLCLYYHRSTVERAIQNAIQRALSLDRYAVANGSLPALDSGNRFTAYVITGSCGGTGSGMFLDVMTMLNRAMVDRGVADGRRLAVIVMPSFYRAVGRNVTEHLKRARGANGYGFLREVQHFFHHPAKWRDHCFDAKQREVEGANRSADNPAPHSCFLMDDEVAGRILTDVGDIYQLSTDALFQMMTRPLGATEVDINAERQTEYLGRIAAFSSMGVSYVIFPRRTIVRCASARVLAEALKSHYLRGISDEERGMARDLAKQLFQRHGDLLDASRKKDQFAGAVGSLRQNVERMGKIEEAAARNPKPRLATAMRKAYTSMRSTVTAAKKEVARVAEESSKACATRLAELLMDTFRSVSAEHSLYFLSAVFKELQELVDEVKLAAPTGDSRSDTASHQNRNLLETAKDMEGLERDLTPDWLQRARIRELRDGFAKGLLSEFDSTVVEEACQWAERYRTDVVSQAIRGADNRCIRAIEQLVVLDNALVDLANRISPAQDEHSLPITTQFVPVGGVSAYVDELASNLRRDPGLRTGMHQRVTEDRNLWILGSERQDEQAAALGKIARSLATWVSQLKPAASVLRMTLAEVAMQAMPAMQFRDEVLPQAQHLADPTWRLDSSRTGGGLQPVQVVVPGWERGFPDSLLPPELADAARGGAVPVEPHKLMLLKIEHGLPLHVLGGVPSLRDDYLGHRHDRTRAQKEPPHVANDWALNPDVELEDVDPPGRYALTQDFALGMFTDWLVRTKRQPEAVRILDPWDKGVVYEAAVNEYNVALITEKNGRLVVQGERPLTTGGRAAAAEAFSQDDKRGVGLFLLKLTNAVGPDAVRSLVREYVEQHLAPRMLPASGIEESRRAQLQKEKEALSLYVLES